MTTRKHDTENTRAAEDRRRLEICDQIEALISGFRDQYPHIHISELPRHMPEPQRTRLMQLLAEAADWMQALAKVKEQEQYQKGG
jgi:hypothetical protein